MLRRVGAPSARLPRLAAPRRVCGCRALGGAAEPASPGAAPPSDLPRDLAAPLPSAYDPTAVEAAWYEWWEAEGLFKPRAGAVRPFAMVLPPPNVTGALHIGHALTVAIQDSLARWRRMRGDAVLWVPGLDHAGIATQTVVEKRLAKERGLTRHDLGREAFTEEVWAWHGQYGRRIVEQLRVLGASLDWSREVFTMDAQRSEAVVEAFVTLHERGLVYRGDRMVNWCPHLRTVLSDIEVDYLTLDGPTDLSLPGRDGATVRFGVIHNFAYPLCPLPGEGEGDGEEIVVGTTRLETMLGDAAVAVHPSDGRYARYVGRHVRHPIHGHELPVVADAELVDVELGSGAVKITPAHDPNDFGCAARHGLPVVTMLDDDGCINAAGAREATEFLGMGRFEARGRLVEKLSEVGCYRGEEGHPMRLGVCSRSADVVEPMIKPQWFVRCEYTSSPRLFAGHCCGLTNAALQSGAGCKGPRAGLTAVLVMAMVAAASGRWVWQRRRTVRCHRVGSMCRRLGIGMSGTDGWQAQPTATGASADSSGGAIGSRHTDSFQRPPRLPSQRTGQQGATRPARLGALKSDGWLGVTMPRRQPRPSLPTAPLARRGRRGIGWSRTRMCWTRGSPRRFSLSALLAGRAGSSRDPTPLLALGCEASTRWT